MKKKISPSLVLSNLLCLSPLLATALLYDRVPARVITSWGFDGQPQGDGPKEWALIGLPIFLAAMNLLLRFALRSDPKSGGASGALKSISLFILPVMSVFLYAVIVLGALGYPINPSRYVMVFIGLLFVLIGNYLPKSRQSYTVGIKTPWTLDNEENWNKTHRMAGPIWVVAGLVTATSPFLPFGGILAALVLGAAALIPCIYSYRLYRGNRP